MKIKKMFFLMFLGLLLVPVVFSQIDQGINAVPPGWGGLGAAAGVTPWGDVFKACVGLGGPGSNCWNMLKNALIGLPSWVFSGGSIWYLIQFLIIPFLGTWMIMYGFMKELRIFRRARKVNTWLAFLAAFSLYPLHIAYPLTLLMFQIIGAWGVVIFGVIFVVGVWKYGIIRRSEWTSRASVLQAEAETKKSIRDQLRALRRERKMLVEEIAYAEGKRLDQLTKRIDKVDEQLQKIQQQEATIEDVES